MGRFIFRLPDIGEGIAEAEIVAWHVKVGDRIEEDCRLADMMTDKATVEMESPVSGVVIELAGAEGDKVSIGAPLAVIEVEGEGEGEGIETSSIAVTSPEIKPDLPELVEQLNLSTGVAPERQKGRSTGLDQSALVFDAASITKVLASPAVRARARGLGIDLAQVRTSPDGRIGHADLDAFLTACVPSTAIVDKAEQKPVEMLSGAGEQIKVIGLRRRIAENMAASKRHIPHFTYVEECDVTALESLRAELNDLRGERPKLTLLPLLITAICRSLPEFPMINARYDEAAGLVTRYTSVHLGVATQTDAGLMVPVIRDVRGQSLWQLAAEIARLAAAARDGSATKEELSGSTLTITSLGTLGGVATTPVINRPEVAIIGPNRIVERPVFVGEQIERRKLMNISISCDHRVVDGFDAASFVQAVKRFLESPLALLAG